MAEPGAEGVRVWAELRRLRERVAAIEGELRAVRRQAGRAPPEPHQVVRRAEAAALLDMKPATLAAWARDGRGPPFHIRGNRAWYRVADVMAWRETVEREAPARPSGPPAGEAQAEGRSRLPGV